MTKSRVNSARARPGAVPKRRMASEDRRRQILAIAAEIFAERGYAGTTTKQIAEAAGVSEPIVFRLFATKEDLYTAILEDRRPREGLEEWLAELRAIADRKDDEALLCAIAAGILRSHREDPVSHRLILYAALENHRLGSVLQLKYLMPVVSFLREYVSRRQAEGAFRLVSPDMVAAGIAALPAHIAQWSGFGLNPFGLTDDDVLAFSRLFVVGLRLEE